jgi:CheY-like chemotaxis protein
MSGFEVMEEMNKDSQLKEIPVIVISNSGQPVELDRARELGAKDWLIKTEFDPQEVLKKVKQQLEKVTE